MLPGTRKIRIGVMGLGIGRWHIENYLAIPEAKVAAICDSDEEKLKTAVIRYGITKAYANYEELCQSDDVDAVSICAPNHVHASVAVHALEHGKHVLCEPPVSISTAEGEKVLETVNKYPDLKAMMAMKLRFSKDAVCLKTIIENGELGEIYYGFTTHLKQPAGIPKSGSWVTRKKLSGGGSLMDNGVHFLDLIWWLMGCPTPVEAFGATYSIFGSHSKGSTGDFDVEDLALGIVKFENGASVMFDNAWAAMVHKEATGMRLCGTRGGATLWPFQICYAENGVIVSKTPDLPRINSENQFRHFINCILDDRQPIPTIGQGVTVLKMLDAIYRSAEKGESVAV